MVLEDDGPDILQDEREDVVDTGYTDAGSGMGLTIVAQVPDPHRWMGRVGESSEGGARFDIRDGECAASA